MVQFITQYLVAVVGIVVGGSAGWMLAAAMNRRSGDAKLTPGKGCARIATRAQRATH